MNVLTVTGIVISAMPIGEYDKRLVILTKEQGKITVFVRGARRLNSPYMAGSRPFSFGEFSVYKGRDAYSLNGMKISNYFDELTKDFDITCLAMYFLEVADYYGRENLDATETIQLLYQTFRALANEHIPNELIRVIYELKMLVINGEYPEMFKCVNCSKTENLKAFSFMRNGMLCGECTTKDEYFIEGSTVYALQFIISSDISKLYTFNVTDKVLSEIKEIVSRFLKSRIDVKFKTLDMLNF